MVEIVSPDDESWAKMDFYAEAEGSALLGITTAELASRIDWPPVS